MKVTLQYLVDTEGKPQAVQLSLTDWEKVVSKLKKHEQTLKIQSDLTEAFQEVTQLRKSKDNDTSRDDFRMLLLNGPTFSKKQLDKIAKTRKRINQL